MKHPRDFSIDEILASNWDKRLAHDIAAELELASGEPRTSIPEIRRFFAIRSCRNLLGRLESARNGKSSFSALRQSPLKCAGLRSSTLHWLQRLFAHL